jgi:hypothetical protein
MLTTQGGRLEQALIAGGVNPLAANAAMVAVANCAQPLQHRGPVSIDNTPQDFRFVTPELRKFRFGNMDNVTAEMPPIKKPQEQKKKPPEREDHPPEQQEPRTVTQRFDQLEGSGGRGIDGITAGRYITVNGDARRPRVSLNGGGSGGQVAVFSGNQLVGQKFDVTSTNPKVIKVSQQGLRVQIGPQGTYGDVVTDVQVSDKSLTVTKRRCFILDGAAPKPQDIALRRITYVSDATLSGDALEFETRDAYIVCGEDRSGSPIKIPLVDCEV